MIDKLTLHNFKSIGTQSYDFTDFDLLVGRNNSGKSTVLQALAIWQFCVDEFHRTKRSGSTGIQIVLPNFTALPVPEFNLLWKDRTDRFYPTENGSKKQKFILIEITVQWRDPANVPRVLGVELRYHSPQTIYATPVGGWAAFRECDKTGHLPRIAFVPPFSGLEPSEKWLDVAPTRQQVGKGQPGSVLRNLLLRVCPTPPWDALGKVSKGYAVPDDWAELASVVQRWFTVELLPPQYDSAKDVHISVEYKQNGKTYDLISGGSGFHQTMTLLAFLYGYQPTTILLDEPDAHLHVNLQREILDYFKKKSYEKGVQFLIATHAEEFIKGVDAHQILSLLQQQKPKRIESAPQVLRAMAEVSNEEITRLMGSPYIVYVEGETDERILRAWAQQCAALPVMDKIVFKIMGGGNKQDMKRLADEHFEALAQIVPNVKRLMLFDYDSEDEAFHPKSNNPALAEWRRKNIENYLLVAPAWKRAALQALQQPPDLFAQPVLQAIDQFFADENLTLPASKTWRNVSANIFQEVDGKRILFKNNASLFHILREGVPTVEVLRDRVAAAMATDEIHEDVHEFFGKLIALVGNTHHATV